MAVFELPEPDGSPLAATVATPTGARVAYVVGADGDRPVVHVVAADGSGDSRVAAGTTPDWRSPPFESGDLLALGCAPAARAEATAVCLAELDSAWELTLLKDARAPRWSPAGDALAFDRSAGESDTSWVVDLSDFHPRTSEQTPGAQTALPGTNARWSPFGDRLVVGADGGEGVEPLLSVMRPDGSELRTLGRGRFPAWSADGRRLAAATADGSHTRITAYSVLTGATEVLAELDHPIMALRWLPQDGLALVAMGAASAGGDLYVIELADGTVRSLSADLAVRPDLSVSPDGQWIAFSATDGVDSQDIYLASRSGGFRRLTESGEASLPAWQSYRPMWERGDYVQPTVGRLRVRSRPWIGDDSVRYEPLLSQRHVLQVLDGPVAGSGYWWYRVRLAAWEDQRLRGGSRRATRSGWVAAADHDGSAWIGSVDVDPGPPTVPLRRGWPAVGRGGVRLAAEQPSIDSEGALTVRATVGGLYPRTALTLEVEGRPEVEWSCDPSGSDVSGPVDEARAGIPTDDVIRSWAELTAGTDGTGTVKLTLLPSSAAADVCPPGWLGTPVTTAVRWEGVRVIDPSHRLMLRAGVAVDGG